MLQCTNRTLEVIEVNINNVKFVRCKINIYRLYFNFISSCLIIPLGLQALNCCYKS